MFIVWSGLGFLSILIVGFVSIVVGVILDLVFGALGYPQLIVLAADIGLLAGAAANWYVGKRLNSVPPRELLDTQTGQRVLLTRRHKLFWIEMQYWSIPVALFAVLMLLTMLLTLHT
ncbi:hypothetical protein EWE75_08720 [Sphingomonas populi]|uniref:Uncharacterized protein n=1 Tax=Sphingomonas populi TaxID=2484750 RepID=A0A4Q6XW57_9SPHN|nr:hypothetical protein [Sphingomonas populi]RZF64933.1 hypothetical protein EWE75_08720 [Sphingomonas populi]